MFDFNETQLSPKDLERHVSLRIRILLFVSAWVSTTWFLVVPFIDSMRVGYGVTLLLFQVWWLSIMLWVCRWSYAGLSACQRNFEMAMFSIRTEKDGHTTLASGYTVPELVHWIIIPNYKEDLGILRASLNASAMQSIGAQRICILLACEGVEEGALEKLQPLAAEFPEFRKFIVNVHQLGEGEVAGKSANTSAAFRSLCAATYSATKDVRLMSVATNLARDFEHWHESNDVRANDFAVFNAVMERGVVTVIDADSVLHPFHLYGLEQSYHFQHRAVHDRCIWQAPIANLLNMWRTPSVTRLTSIIVSLHELASLMQPEQQKLPFSTYSLTVKLALDMGGWASDVLAEDWHCYERIFFAKRGNCTIVPLYFPVLCYGVEETTYWRSLKARFEQARRHAWGVIEVACVFGFWRDTPWYQRPPLTSFAALFWKTFKLHFITIFQTPMIIGSTIFHARLIAEGFAVTNIPHDRFDAPNYKDALWMIYSLTSCLALVLPLITILSFLTALRYERLLRAQQIEAHNWVALESVAKRCGVANYVARPRSGSVRYSCPNELMPYEVSDYLNKNIRMPRSGLCDRIALFLEFLIVMPLASLIYGFLPALISQSILPFRKHYAYVVAPKPQKSQLGFV